MYTTFKIPKRDGSFRTIEAPNESLKKIQRDMIGKLRKEVKVSPFAHAFQPYKNIVTMAMPHVNKAWVGSIDVHDFFPSIAWTAFTRHVRLPKSASFLLKPGFYDFGDGKGMRLPQGAPTSPLLSNAYLFAFDWQMARKCQTKGCDYSRYADDIVVSGDRREVVSEMLAFARDVLERGYHLKINAKKTKIIGKKRRQLVCGVVVNEKINLPRKWRKNLRAELFQAKGPLTQVTRGKIAFRDMVLHTKKTTNSSSDIVNSVIISRKLSL